MVVGKADSLPELVPLLAAEMGGECGLLENRRGGGGMIGAELDAGHGSKDDDSGPVDIAVGVGELVAGSV